MIDKEKDTCNICNVMMFAFSETILFCYVGGMGDGND